MVKHIILWQLAEEYKTEEIKKGIKEGLESLQGKIPGMIDIHVQIDCLESSNADALLITTFEDEESLKGYAVHPEHAAIANTKVRPYTCSRVCMDYED
ncbi:Dabb family protein [Kandleria vitulina]|nr:Dabb family protein [Kandleria vitulina]